ncbi:MAG: bifunctional 2-polyprenyl-6-hydroxyphenol methylase/3-demethylubiquinol 3-O-methyltransferase UbiG [Geminicoccaceae bacterium]
MPKPGTLSPSADPKEIERFDALAGDWWDEAGPMAPLHKLNPLRLAFIRDRICAYRGLDGRTKMPLKGLRVLDIGCGGGLLSEPLARMGAEVTGIDLAPASIEGAKRHAAQAGLKIDYRNAAVDDLVADGERFDLVCAMEVVEHVADQPAFLKGAASLVQPATGGNGATEDKGSAGGALIMATLNRTVSSFALGIVAAEYVLGWLPKGTHSWSSFVRPSEAARALRSGGLKIEDLTGVAYDPLRDRFRLTPDPAVNYMLFATAR